MGGREPWRPPWGLTQTAAPWEGAFALLPAGAPGEGQQLGNCLSKLEDGWIPLTEPRSLLKRLPSASDWLPSPGGQRAEQDEAEGYQQAAFVSLLLQNSFQKDLHLPAISSLHLGPIKLVYS